MVWTILIIIRMASKNNWQTDTVRNHRMDSVRQWYVRVCWCECIGEMRIVCQYVFVSQFTQICFDMNIFCHFFFSFFFRMRISSKRRIRNLFRLTFFPSVNWCNCCWCGDFMKLTDSVFVIFLHIFFYFIFGVARNYNAMERSTRMDTSKVSVMVMPLPLQPSVSPPQLRRPQRRKNRMSRFHCLQPFSRTWDFICWFYWAFWINCCSNQRLPSKNIEMWVIRVIEYTALPMWNVCVCVCDVCTWMCQYWNDCRSHALAGLRLHDFLSLCRNQHCGSL